MPLRESETRVLLALLRDGETPIMSLTVTAKLGGNAVYNAIRWLSDRGLVSDQRETTQPRRRIVRLTEKGKQIASLLEQVEEHL